MHYILQWQFLAFCQTRDLPVHNLHQRFFLHHEVRIKGTGANDEEQLQGIIDAIRSKYLAQLRSSKKVVVTLCASSDPSSLLEKFADCMDGLTVVWQTRSLVTSELKNIELSLVYVL